MTQLDTQILELNKINYERDTLLDNLFDLIESKHTVYVNVYKDNKLVCKKYALEDVHYDGDCNALSIKLYNEPPIFGDTKLLLFLNRYKKEWSFNKEDLTKTFKKGDRVKVVRFDSMEKYKLTGVVTEATNSRGTTMVHLDTEETDFSCIFDAAELELL